MTRSIHQICRSLLGLCVAVAPLLAVDFPLSPGDLSLQKGKVDPNADAECMLWDIRVNNEALNGGQDTLTTFTYFVRIKIFTDGGVKKYGTVDLPYGQKERVADVTGRTIEPDGSMIELQKDAIFSHTLEKLHRRKTEAISFAMPGVKPGAIIEYRYKVYEDTIWDYVPLPAQMEIPVERVVYHVKPLDTYYTSYRMGMRSFRINVPDPKPEQSGFSVTSAENIPAFHPEEDAPPDREIQPWVLIYYTENIKEDADHFWKHKGKELYQGYSKDVKVNGDVKQIAEQVTNGAKTDDEKLANIYYYCQKHIKNVYGRDVSDAERQAFKPNKNTIDTLKRSEGTAYDITTAFIALAEAAGYDARLARLADRESMIFRKEFMVPFFTVRDAAVNVNGKWRFYDPATPWLAAGQLRWQEQGVEALLPDPKDSEFTVVAVTPAEETNRKQVARVTLDEQGALEGELEETFTGQFAAEWRGENIEHSEAERKKQFEEAIHLRLPGAEITDIKLSDPADVTIPVKVSCKVKMDGFATRTGKRLFFTPALFQINAPARYSETTRKYDLLYKFPWSETEDVSITFPEGFQLDHADLARSD